MSKLTLFHPPGLLSTPANPFGKDIANSGLFRALIDLNLFEEISIVHSPSIDKEELLKSSLDFNGFTEIKFIDFSSYDFTSCSDTLLRGQPYLHDLTWSRSSSLSSYQYSINGLIHTLAPPAIRETIGRLLLSPIYPWDALICTSPAVQTSMKNLFQGYKEYLGSRLSATSILEPQLPLIPLGVDIGHFRALSTNELYRNTLRSRLSISQQDIVVLWVGRLSFFEKAFPQAMFQAVDLANKNSQNKIHFLLAGWFPNGARDLDLYQEAAAKLAPDLNVVVLDGNDPKLVDQCWASADIFLSLVDNIQETFGITPIEAMACSLPCVVSDWNGYSYTVRNNIDGFLIPTLLPGDCSLGQTLSMLHLYELQTYQDYVGSIAQHTAVDIYAAAHALQLLADNAELRKKLGSSAFNRAQAEFSFKSVASLYYELFAEQHILRSTMSSELLDNPVVHDPLRGNPFIDFAHFSSHTLSPSLIISVRSKDVIQDFEKLHTIRLNQVYSDFHSAADLSIDILHFLIDCDLQRSTVSDLLLHFGVDRHSILCATICWLAKMGLVSWL